MWFKHHASLFLMNKNDLWNLVVNNDKKIYDLASYYETRGYTSLLNPIECKDKIQARFAEFKKRIMIGSVTLAQLEVDVLKKCGVTEGAQYSSVPVEALPNDIKDMIEKLSVEVEE